LNTSRMNRYLGIRRDEQGRFLLRVAPGVVLSELRKQLGKKVLPTAGWDQASLEAYEEFQEAPEQFFPTDPTEASACLGGMAACNASGARSYAYGPMRPHVTGLHVALTDGDLLELQRGEVFARGRRLSLVTVQGRTLELDLPDYTMPKTKNASGYFVADDMDAIDLFIGACGTLGVITELEIALQAAPAVAWGVSCFFDSEDKAVSFTDSVRPVLSHAAAIEYFDAGALDILRRQREQSTAFASLPALDKDAKVCVYVELDCDDEAQATEELYHLGWVLELAGGSACERGSRVPRSIASASDSSAMRYPRASICSSTSVAARIPLSPNWARTCRCPTRAWPMSSPCIAARWPKAGLNLPPGGTSVTTICM
ncbi:MAG: FAD-binding oxidoreductase, partial [Collinsella sp.]